MSRITAPVGEVTTPITRGRNGSLRLRAGVEQPFGGERLAALFEQGQQRALARQLHPLDDDLVFRAPGIGGELAGRDDLGAVFGPEREAPGAGAPDHRVDARILVLEREIAVTGRMALEPADLAAHADLAERVLDRALERARQLADRQRAANCRRGRRSLTGRHAFRQGRSMDILLLGSGGREDALAWRLRQSPSCGQLIAAPGNPGIARWAECVAIDPCEPRRRGRAGAGRGHRPRRRRARSAAGRRRRRCAARRGHRRIRPECRGRAARRIEGLHQGPVPRQRHPDRRLCARRDRCRRRACRARPASACRW